MDCLRRDSGMSVTKMQRRLNRKKEIRRLCVTKTEEEKVLRKGDEQNPNRRSPWVLVIQEKSQTGPDWRTEVGDEMEAISKITVKKSQYKSKDRKDHRQRCGRLGKVFFKMIPTLAHMLEWPVWFDNKGSKLNCTTKKCAVTVRGGQELLEWLVLRTHLRS